MEATNSKGRLEIIVDEDAENPRNWDNLGTMLYAHRRYELGDKTFNSNDYSGWKDALVSEAGNEIIFLPLYLYDHSGITMSTTEFSCPWDSGQVGWIYVTKEDARKEYGVKRITKKVREQIEARLKSEVNTFDQYITGDVYGFRVYDAEGEEVDSCWGFFGSDVHENGIADHIEDEYKELLDLLH